MNIAQLARDIHADNVAAGWWNDWKTREARAPTALMLAITELAEAAEGIRKDLPDDHLPQYPMAHVELADTFIRLADLGGALNVDLGTPIDHLATEYAHDFNDDDVQNDIHRLFIVVRAIAAPTNDWQLIIRHGIAAVIALAVVWETDLWEIVEAKRAYNAQRADHKPEARAAAHGKKY